MTEAATPAGWGVTLYIREPEAVDAADAVERLFSRVVDQGLRGFVYAVEDLDSGRLHFVEGGQTFTQTEYLAQQGDDGGDGD